MNQYTVQPEDRGPRIFVRFNCNDEPIGYLSLYTEDKELYDRLLRTLTDYNTYTREKAGDIAPLTTRTKQPMDK